MNEYNSPNREKWRAKIQEIINTCQLELKKTTKIGKKMINASKTNVQLHEAYENLGHMLYTAIKNNQHEWNDTKVNELVKLIGLLENELEEIELEVQKIKISSNFKDPDSQS